MDGGLEPFGSSRLSNNMTTSKDRDQEYPGSGPSLEEPAGLHLGEGCLKVVVWRRLERSGEPWSD